MRLNNSKHIQEFADDLKNFVDRSSTKHLGHEVQTILSNTQLVASITAAMAKEAEWLYLGEISKATFLVRIKEIENEYETKLAKVTK